MKGSSNPIRNSWAAPLRCIHTAIICASRRKASASSLIEVTTALVIIAMVFSLAIVIYLNVQKSGFSSKQLSYILILDEAYALMEVTQTGTDEFSYNDITVFSDVAVHAANPALFVINLQARNEDGKLVAEKNFLKYVPPQP